MAQQVCAWRLNFIPCFMSIRETSFTLIFVLASAMLTVGQSIDGKKLIEKNAGLTLISSEFKFTEGPATDADGNVFFTDQPNDRIMRWSTDGILSVFMEGAGRSNGLYFDHQGNLVSCADLDNELW